MILIIIITAVSLLCYYYLTKNLDFWKKRGVKYVEAMPIFGNMYPTVFQSVASADLMEEWYNKFPNERFFGIFSFTDPVLVVKDVELAKKIGIKDFEHFVDHQEMIVPDADPLWSKSLFGSNGNRWRDIRRNLTPLFTGSKLRSMFTLIDDCARGFVDYFKEQDKTLIEVEMKDAFDRFTNDVIASTALGVEINSLRDKNNDLFLHAEKLADFSGIRGILFLLCGCYPNLTKLLKLKLISNDIGDFYASVLKEIIKTRERNKITRADFINLLMKARSGKLRNEDNQNLKEADSSNNNKFLSDVDITAQALEFFIGGFDTVSGALSFASYELALNPGPQQRLREEIQKVFEECNGQLTYDHINNMKYMDMLFNESLRKWSTSAWIDRKCTKRFEIKSEKEGEPDLILEEGQLVWIPVHAVHHDPKYYTDPEKFDPERFSDENKGNIQSCTHYPFGLGPRMCIGKRLGTFEIKTLLFYLLKDFEIVTLPKTEIPLKIGSDNLSMKSKNGIHLGFKRLSNPLKTA